MSISFPAVVLLLSLTAVAAGEVPRQHGIDGPTCRRNRQRGGPGACLPWLLIVPRGRLARQRGAFALVVYPTSWLKGGRAWSKVDKEPMSYSAVSPQRGKVKVQGAWELGASWVGVVLMQPSCPLP